MASKTLKVDIVGDASSLQRALGKAQGSTRKFSGYLKYALGTAALTGAAALGTAGVASIKMAIDFESSMTKIGALVGASDKQLESYKQGVLDLAKTVPIGPKALADALYFVTSAGFKGKQALDILTASAKAAAAGLGDTAVVADAVTSAVNAYGIKTLKAATATDVLLATVREGKAEPEELAASIGRVIAPAEAMGVTFQEVGGTLAGLSLTGLDAAEAVTGLRGILGSLLKPSQEANTFLESVGLSMKALREQVDKKGLLKTLQSLRDRFGDNKEALAKLFPNVRALNAFLSLTGRNAEKNAAVMERVTHAVGDTDKAFKEASESAKFQLGVAWSQLQVAMIKFGSVALPLVIKAAQQLGPVLKMLGKFAAMLRERWAQLNAMLERNQETVNQVVVVLRVLGMGLKLLIRWELLLYGTILKVWIGTLNVTLKVVGGIIGAVQSVIGWLKTLGGFFRAVGSAARTAFAVARAAVLGFISPILTVIGYVQTLIGWINKIPDIPGFGGGSGPSLQDLGGQGGRFGGFREGATGGRITRTGLLKVHRGEDLVPARIARGMGGGGGTIIFNFPHYVGDKRELESAMRDVVTKFARANGGRLAF